MASKWIFVYIFQFFLIMKFANMSKSIKDFSDDFMKRMSGSANLYGEKCKKGLSCNHPLSCISEICQCHDLYELKYSHKAQLICIPNSNLKLKSLNQTASCVHCDGENKYCDDDSICRCVNGTVGFIKEKHFLNQQLVEFAPCVPMSHQNIFEQCGVTEKHAHVCDIGYMPGYNNTYCRNSKCVCLKDYFYDFVETKCQLKTSFTNYSQHDAYKADIDGYCLDHNDCLISMECHQNTLMCRCPKDRLYNDTLSRCISNSTDPEIKKPIKGTKPKFFYNKSCNITSDCSSGLSCNKSLCKCPRPCTYDGPTYSCDCGPVSTQMPTSMIVCTVILSFLSVVFWIWAIRRSYKRMTGNKSSRVNSLDYTNNELQAQPTTNSEPYRIRTSVSAFETPTSVAPPTARPTAPPTPYKDNDAPPSYNEIMKDSFFPPPSAPSPLKNSGNTPYPISPLNPGAQSYLSDSGVSNPIFPLNSGAGPYPTDSEPYSISPGNATRAGPYPTDSEPYPISPGNATGACPYPQKLEDPPIGFNVSSASPTISSTLV